MDGPVVPIDESARVSALRALNLLDTAPEERFDRVTRLAQRLFDVPIALVSLVDTDRQWFKSRQGLEATETPREASFCSHAILDTSVMHVPDATADERFAANPLVTGDPEIRFYAGCPIAGPNGATLGTLCIIDCKPRNLTDQDAASLRDLAAMVEREIAVVHLATVDDLTGLSNRRGFQALGGEVLELCRRRGLPAALVAFDLDDFKAINDRLGHAAGDAALREFATKLEAAFRGSDILARMGGDEFALLLTGAEDLDVDVAVTRLHQSLRPRDATPGRGSAINFSCGTAMFDPSSGETLDQITARADAAMYADKVRRTTAREGLEASGR